MRDAPSIVARAAVAAVSAAIVPPLGMVCLWAALSGAPMRFIAELGISG